MMNIYPLEGVFFDNPQIRNASGDFGQLDFLGYTEQAVPTAITPAAS